MKKKKKQKHPFFPTPMAHALSDRCFHPRVISSQKTYNRKKGHFANDLKRRNNRSYGD